MGYKFKTNQTHDGSLEVGPLTFKIRKPRLTDLTWLQHGEGKNSYASESMRVSREIFEWKQKHGLFNLDKDEEFLAKHDLDPESDDFQIEFQKAYASRFQEAYAQDPYEIVMEVEPEDIEKHQKYLCRLIVEVDGLQDAESSNALSWDQLTKKEQQRLLDEVCDDRDFAELNALATNLYLRHKTELNYSDLEEQVRTGAQEQTG